MPTSPARPLARRPKRRTPLQIDVSAATFRRLVVTAVIAWMWWLLWQWVLIFIAAVFIAIGLDPAVRRLEGVGVRRRYGAPLVAAVLVLVVVGFLVMAGASLTEDARALGSRVNEFRGAVLNRLPVELQQAATSLSPSPESLANAGNALAGGLASIGVALVVALYLLLDGRRTLQWLIAFAPARYRGRVRRTAERGRVIAWAYVRANVITSVLAFAFTWVVLASLQVPAALLLALLAGLLDILPIVGFFISAAPAVLLALAVSPMVTVGVIVFYVAYNIVEGYYIQPKVFGRELQLSDLAVIAAFIVGGTLGGVLGALIALPVAALYPAVEQIWFDGPAADDTADQHRRIEAQPEH